MASTPPPPTLRSPTSPRHGAGFDEFAPDSGRRSIRLARRRGSQQFSVSPASSSPGSRAQSGSCIVGSSSQPQSEDPALSPPQSGADSPRRSDRSKRHALHCPPTDNTVEATSSYTSSAHPHDMSHINPDNHTVTASTMLPTPAKTPRKKTVPHPGPVARNLFASRSEVHEPEMPSSKRQKGKKFKSYSLESFNEDLEDKGSDNIVIFTDSRDRIPEANHNKDNPFLSKSDDIGERDRDMPERKTKKRRMSNPSGQRDKEVDEAIRRDDGMLYVFRGKKSFRKFKPESEEDDDETDLGLLASRPDLLEGTTMPHVRPLTRSSIKPRILFPTASQRAARESNDGSAETSSSATDKRDQTPPVSAPDDAFVTPPVRTDVSTPASPGASGRSLRSHTKKSELEIEATPSGHATKEIKRNSPFDGWRRTKSQAASSRLRKRITVPTESSGEPEAKKARSK